MNQRNNKKLYLAMSVTALSAGIVTCFLPWWMIAVCSFVVAVSMNLGAGKGFLAGAGGIGLLWLIVLLWRDIPNEHIFSSRMATLILGSPNYIILILVTVVLGALVGGLSGWSAGLMNKAFRRSD